MSTPVVPAPPSDESPAALSANAALSSTSASATIAATGFIQSRRSDSPAPTRANSLASNSETAADGDHVPEFMSLKLKSVKQDSYSPTSTLSSIYSGGPVPTRSVSKKSSVTHWPKVKDLVKNIETDPAEESSASPLQLDQLTPSQIRAYSPTLLDRPNPTEAVKSIFCNPDESLPLPTLTPAERVGREARELRTRSRSVIKPNYMTPEVSTFSEAWNYGARSRRGSEYSDTATSEHSTLYLRSKSTPAPVSRPPSPETRGDVEPAYGAKDLMSSRSTATLRPQQEYPANIDNLKTDPEVSKPEIDGNISDGSDCSTLSTRVTKIKSSHPSSVTPQKPVEKVNSLREYFETVAGSSAGSPPYSVSPSFQRSFTSPPVNSSSLSTSAPDASTEFRHLHTFGMSETESAFFAPKRRASSPGMETKAPQQALPYTAIGAEDIYANEKLSDETQLKREFKSVVEELEFRLRDKEEVAPRTTDYSPYNSTPDRVVRVKEILKTAVVPGSFGSDVSRLETDAQNGNAIGLSVVETSTDRRTIVTETNYPSEKFSDTQCSIQFSSTGPSNEAQMAVLPVTLTTSIESVSTAAEHQTRDASNDNIAVASLSDRQGSTFTTKYSQKRTSEISSDTNENSTQETNLQTTVTTVITTTTTTSKSSASSTPVHDVRVTSTSSEQTSGNVEKESVLFGRESAIQDSRKHSAETEAVVRKMSIANLLSESGPSFLRGRSSSNRKISADTETVSSPGLPQISEGEETSHTIVTKTVSETHDSSELVKDTASSVERDSNETEIVEKKKMDDVSSFSSVLKMFRSRASSSTAAAPIAENSLVDGLESTQGVVAEVVPTTHEPQESTTEISSVTEIPAITEIARKESNLTDDSAEITSLASHSNGNKTITTSTTSTTITTTTSEKPAESTAAGSVADPPAGLAPRRKVVLTMRRKSATQRATEASDSNSMDQMELTAATADEPAQLTASIKPTDELLIADKTVTDTVADVRMDEASEPNAVTTEESTPVITTTFETETITTTSTRRSLTSSGGEAGDELENANQESTAEEKYLSTEEDSCVSGQCAPSYEAVEFPTSEEIIIESEVNSDTPLVEGQSFSSELTVTPARHVVTAEEQTVAVDGARSRGGTIVESLVAAHEASNNSETVGGRIESLVASTSMDDSSASSRTDTFTTVTKTTVTEAHVSVSAEAAPSVEQGIVAQPGPASNGPNSTEHDNGVETRYTTETTVTVEKTVGFSPVEVLSHTAAMEDKHDHLTSTVETPLSSEHSLDDDLRTQTEADSKVDVPEEKSTDHATIESPAADDVSDILADDIILAEGGYSSDPIASVAANDADVTENSNASREADDVEQSTAVSNSAEYQSVPSIPVVRESKSVFSSLFSSFRSRPVLKPATDQSADSTPTTDVVSPSTVSGAAAAQAFSHAEGERLSDNEISRVFVHEVQTAENHPDQSERNDEEGPKNADFKVPSSDNLDENAVIEESVESTSEGQRIVSRTVVVTEESGTKTPKTSTVTELIVTEVKEVSDAPAIDIPAVMPHNDASVVCEERAVQETRASTEIGAENTVKEMAFQQEAIHALHAAKVSAIAEEPADKFINSSHETETITTTITVTRSIEGGQRQMVPSLQEVMRNKSSLYVSAEAPSKMEVASMVSSETHQVEISTDVMNEDAMRTSAQEYLPVVDVSDSLHSASTISMESVEKHLDRHLTAIEFGNTTEVLSDSNENVATEASSLIVETPTENDSGVIVSSTTYSTSYEPHDAEAGLMDGVLPKESQGNVVATAASENLLQTFSSIFSAFTARKSSLASIPIGNEVANESEITSEKPNLRNNSQTSITETSETSLTTTVAELDLPETSKAKLFDAETETVIENFGSTCSNNSDGDAHSKSLNDSVLYLQQQLEDLSKEKVSSTRTLETALEAKMKSNVVETEVSNSKSLPTILPNAKTHVLKRSKHSIQLIPKQKFQTESSENEPEMTISDNIFSPTTGVEVINVKLSDLADMDAVHLEEVWDSESHPESPSSWSAKNSTLSRTEVSATTEPLTPVSVVDMLSTSPTQVSSAVKSTSEDTVEVVKLKDLEEIEKGYRRLSGIWQPGQEQLTSTVVGSAVETDLLTSFMNAVPAQELPASIEEKRVEEPRGAVDTIESTSKTQAFSEEQEISRVKPSPAATSMKSMFQKLFGARSDRGSDGYERMGLLKEEDERSDSSEPLLKTHDPTPETEVPSVKVTASLDATPSLEVPNTERVVKPTRSALQLRKVLSLIDSAMDDLAEDGIECESASDFESRSIRTVSSMSSMKNDASFGALAEGAKQIDNNSTLDSRNDDTAPKSTLTSLFSTFRSRKSSLKPPSTYSAVGTIDEDDSEFEGDTEATAAMSQLSGASSSHAHGLKMPTHSIVQDTPQASQESHEAVTSLFPSFRSRTSSLKTNVESGPVISEMSPVVPNIGDNLPLNDGDIAGTVSKAAESEKDAIITQSCEASKFNVETTMNVNMEISGTVTHNSLDASLISRDEPGAATVASVSEGTKKLEAGNVTAGVECESPKVAVEGAGILSDHHMPMQLADVRDDHSELAMGVSSSTRVVQILETVTTQSFSSETKSFPPEVKELVKEATVSSIAKEVSETVEGTVLADKMLSGLEPSSEHELSSAKHELIINHSSADKQATTDPKKFVSDLSSRSEELGRLETERTESVVETRVTDLNPKLIVHEETASFQSHSPAVEVHEERNQTDTSEEPKSVLSSLFSSFKTRSSSRQLSEVPQSSRDVRLEPNSLEAAQHTELVIKYEEKEVDEAEQSPSTELPLTDTGSSTILQKKDEFLLQRELESGSQTLVQSENDTSNVATANGIETTTESINFASSHQLARGAEPDLVQGTAVVESKDAEMPSISASDESLMHLEQTTIPCEETHTEDAALEEAPLNELATQVQHSIETKLVQDSKSSPVTYSDEFVIEEPIAGMKQAKSVFSSMFSTFHSRPSLKVSDSITFPTVKNIAETAGEIAHRDDVRQQAQPAEAYNEVHTQKSGELVPRFDAAEKTDDTFRKIELLETKASCPSDGAVSEQISLQVHTVTTSVVRIDESRPLIATKLATNPSSSAILTEHLNQFVDDVPSEADLDKQNIRPELIGRTDITSDGFQTANLAHELSERVCLVDSSKPVALNASEAVETIISTVFSSNPETSLQMTSPHSVIEMKVNVEAGLSADALSFKEEVVIERAVAQVATEQFTQGATDQMTQASTEQITTEEVRTERVAPEEAMSEHGTVEADITEQASTEHVTTERVTTELVTTKQVTTEQVTTEQVATKEVAAEVAIEQVATGQNTEQVSVEQVATDQSIEVLDEKTTVESVTVEQISSVHVVTERNSVEHNDSAEDSSTDVHKALDSLDELDRNSLPSAPPILETTVDQNSIFTSLLSSFGTRKSSMNSGLAKEVTSEGNSVDVSGLSRTAVVEEAVVVENEMRDSEAQGTSDKVEKLCSTSEKPDTEPTASKLSETPKAEESPQCTEEQSHEEKARTFSIGKSISEISFGNSMEELVRSIDNSHQLPRVSDKNAVVHTPAEEEYRVFPFPAKTRKSMISMFSSWSKPVASHQPENDTTKLTDKSIAAGSAVDSTVQHAELEPHIDVEKQTNKIQMAVTEPHSADATHLIVEEPHNSSEVVVAHEKVFDAPNVGAEISINAAGSDRPIITSEREVQGGSTTSTTVTTTRFITTTTTTSFGAASAVEHGRNVPSLEKDLVIVLETVPSTQAVERAALEPFGQIESISQYVSNKIAVTSHEADSPTAGNDFTTFSTQTATSELRIVANASDSIYNSDGQSESVQTKAIPKRAYISSSAVIEIVRVKASFTFTSESVCSSAAVYCTLGNWWASVAMALVSTEPFIYAAEVELPGSVNTGDSVLYSFIIDGVWVEVPDANVQKCSKAFQVYLVPDISDRSVRRNASLVTEAWNAGKNFSKTEKVVVSSVMRQELQQELHSAIHPEEVVSSIVTQEEQREDMSHMLVSQENIQAPQERGISSDEIVIHGVTQETILSTDDMVHSKPRAIETIEMQHRNGILTGNIAVEEVVTGSITEKTIISSDQILQGIITEEGMPQETRALSEVVVEKRVVSVDLSERTVTSIEEVAQIDVAESEAPQEKIIPNEVTQAEISIVGNKTQHDTSQPAFTSDSNVSSMHTDVSAVSPEEIVHQIVETVHHHAKPVDLTENVSEHVDRSVPANPVVESNAQPRMRFSFLSQWTRSNAQDEPQPSSTHQKIALTDDSHEIAAEEFKSEEIAVLTTQATEISYSKSSTGETSMLAASPCSEADNVLDSLVQEEVPSVVKEARFDSCDTIVADVKELASGSALEVEEKNRREKGSVSAIETTLSITSQSQNAVSIESLTSLIQEKIYESPKDNHIIEERPTDVSSSIAGQSVVGVEKLSPVSVGDNSSKLSQVDEAQIITTVHTTRRTTNVTVTKNTSLNSSSKLSKLTELSGVNIARVGFLVLFVLYVIYQVLLAVIAPIYELFWDNFHPMWIGNVIMPVTLILVIFYMLNPST
ncbi:hypothetical protein HDU81_000550 [Chytriomyces hyalinus]|nr:hypothetical protein HDU81_000550 [Chytriomyces hyalinus]